MNEINFINNIKDNDKDLFFGPLKDEDVFIDIKPNWTMANLLVSAGIFSSLSQARKNGFSNEIPFGFTDKRVGKLKKRICILNWSK